MEEKEREAYMEQRNKKIATAQATLSNKQLQDMNALKQKLENATNERLKLRDIEHRKLVQRYQNVTNEIETTQQMERFKFEKANSKVYEERKSIGSGSKNQGSAPRKSQLNKSVTSIQSSPASKPSQ